jgi:PEP-CTERM motif
MPSKMFGSKAAVLGMLAMGSVGTAQAIPTTWTDDAGSYGYHLSAGETYSYTHNIKDDPYGYRPGIDTIWNASLSISLYDTFFGDLPLLGDEQETVGFKFDNGSWSAWSDVDSGLLSVDNFDFTVTSLLTDGLLNVWIRAGSGDFYFVNSHLTVNGDRSTSVPEPASLSLFGLGVLAMGLAVRRRRSL